MTGNATIGIERPGFVPPIRLWLIVFVFIIDCLIVRVLVRGFVCCCESFSIAHSTNQSINESINHTLFELCSSCQHYWMGNNVAMGFSQSFSRLISQPVSQSVLVLQLVGVQTGLSVGLQSVGVQTGLSVLSAVNPLLSVVGRQPCGGCR